MLRAVGWWAVVLQGLGADDLDLHGAFGWANAAIATACHSCHTASKQHKLLCNFGTHCTQPAHAAQHVMWTDWAAHWQVVATTLESDTLA